MTNPPTINFKFQIWPGYGKMTNPPTFTVKFKFHIWPGHGKMSDPPTSLKILNFRFGLDMERWLTPDLTKQFKFQIGSGHGKMINPSKNLQFQIVSGHGKMTDPPTPHLKFSISNCVWTWKDDWPTTLTKKILNFRLCLDMVRCPNPTLTKYFKFQIWSGYGKMTDWTTLSKNVKFWIGYGHGKIIKTHCKF